ncbi:DNA replication ATP-dependent helicase/nuclease [Podosphaera aphanis]|nr:DNA replication ATP-dependent helicase/nuclease [Podosphaera aphanis]
MNCGGTVDIITLRGALAAFTSDYPFGPHMEIVERTRVKMSSDNRVERVRICDTIVSNGQRCYQLTGKQKLHRSEWSRNKSFLGKSSPKPDLRIYKEGPRELVSKATKDKLSSFQFNGHVGAGHKSRASLNSLSEEARKNEDTDKERSENQEEQKSPSQTGLKKKASLSLHVLSENPSTPASKLALPDLIGMGDVRRITEQPSPEDRIEWDHNKGILQDFVPNFNAVKKKKRARSSSPIASPTILAAHQFDPVSELWRRYSIRGSSTPQGPSIPALAQIMQISSPKRTQKIEKLRSTINLHRAKTGGENFSKRRRTVGTVSDDVFSDSIPIGPSKLSTLIERVQEGLTKPKLIETPIKTALNPAKIFHEDKKIEGEYSDTMKSRNNIVPESRPLLDKQHPAPITPQSMMPPKTLPKDSGSSDYGDFDDDELDASLIEILGSNSGIPILSPPTISKPVSSPKSPSKAHRIADKQPTKHPVETENNVLPSEMKDIEGDFDDYEDDIFSADLELLVSQYDASSLEKVNCMARKTALKPLNNASVNTDLEDEFEDGSLDDADFEAAEATAAHTVWQTSSSHLTPHREVRAIQRYLVTHTMDSTYEDGKVHKEKILLLHTEKSKNPRVVRLRGAWVETPVTVKSYVHIIGAFDSRGQCIVDNEKNMLILHPDHLLSSTVVADSFGCIRRAVLQDRVKSTSEVSAPLVYGTILHEIFQAAMLSNRWDSDWLLELVQEIATKHLVDLYTIKIQIPHAIEYLRAKMVELQRWAERFISSQPKSQAMVTKLNGETASMCVSKLLDVEEHVWSPMYGLKGNIDVTVQVTIKENENDRTLTVPFEVKTGKSQSVSHHAQTALYNLLLSDRYDIDVAFGVLYYMETSETIQIPNIRHEIRHMIMQRNELACYVRERSSQLPPMLKNQNLCNRCYAKVPCFTYHKLADNGTGETSGLKANFDDSVKHLTSTHKEFFLKWDNLLTKEEKESLRFRRELWTMLSSEREKLGRCFSSMVIDIGSSYEEQKGHKINRYQYDMVKQMTSSQFSFLESQITVGEPIVISDEKGHFALANGYITYVSKHRITVQVDRRLHNSRVRQPGFDETNNQVFVGIMEVASECAHQNTNLREEDKMEANSQISYRVDKDEFSNGMALIRNNLIQIMEDGPFGSRQIRRLVVDLEAPRFKTQSSAYVLQDRASINVDQRRAIQKVMKAEDYALVLGMPGTGKTTTIAHIIRALVSQNKSVLLTSYTHTAVDNILLKLKDDAIPILRLGQFSKISPEVQEFAILAAQSKDSFEGIRSDWHETPIVATTCLGVNHAIFMERTFDYCIVDEASQITLPVCLGPIRLARTFILVGDHYQLPPLVQNEEARSGGLDISLFKLLSDTHPRSVVYLEHQYRMCEDVMTLSNQLIYDGRLKCGSQEVAQREISIPNMDNLRLHHFSPSTLSQSERSICLGSKRNKCWLHDLINAKTKVSFINTDPLVPISREEAKGNRIVNPAEAKICTKLVQTLLSVGVPASCIGVMTLYRSQLALLKHHLRSYSKVEMHTTDRFQGRDKEVIILSLVRSNERKSIGELLKDWRRINVAFTRARTKLLVIGSRETLKGNVAENDNEEEMVARFIKLIEAKNWIYDLPRGALEDHYFEGETQVINDDMTEPESTPSPSQKSVTEQTELDSSQFKREKKLKILESLRDMKGLEKNSGITGKKQPFKRIRGKKPLKIPEFGVFAEVINEAMY